MAKHWTKEEVVRLFELLIEKESDLVSHPEFRKHLDRDGNLFANQVTREANGNIAYRSVDFDVTDDISDQDFWSRIDDTPYNDMIEENAAVAIVKMGEKLKLIH